MNSCSNKFSKHHFRNSFIGLIESSKKLLKADKSGTLSKEIMADSKNNLEHALEQFQLYCELIESGSNPLNLETKKRQIEVLSKNSICPKKVILVDDDSLSRDTWKLFAVGLDIDFYNYPEILLEDIKKNKISLDEYDCIITDMNFQIDESIMNGFDLLNIVKDISQTPVVLSTGHIDNNLDYSDFFAIIMKGERVGPSNFAQWLEEKSK